MVPVALYIKVVWDSYSAEHESVEFSDLQFFKNVYLSTDQDLDLDVNIQRGSGNFEVSS